MREPTQTITTTMQIVLKNKNAFFITSQRLLSIAREEFFWMDEESRKEYEFFKIRTTKRNGKTVFFGVVELGLFPQFLNSNAFKWYIRQGGALQIEDKRHNLARFHGYVKGIKEKRFEGKYVHQMHALKASDNYIQIPSSWSYVGEYCLGNKLYFPRGIHNITTGGGKTVIMAAILESCNPNKYFRQNKMLVTINRDMSFTSLYNEFCDYLGKKSVGRITSSVTELGDLTLCMYQSLNNRLENKAFREKLNREYNILCIDECHTAGADNYQEMLSKLSFGSVYGFSGTSFSENHDHARKKMLIQKTGQELFEFNNKQAIELGINLKPIVKAYKITHEKPYKEYAIHSHYFTNVVAPNKDRVAIMIEEIKKSKYLCLVGFEYKAHGKFLLSQIQEHLPGKRIAYVDGSLNSKQKTSIFKKANEGAYDVILASSSIKEAVNIKCIDRIIATFHSKSDVWVKQLLGRGLRLYKDLKEIYYIDFYDSNLKKAFKEAFQKRLQYYQHQYCDVYTYDVEQIKQGNTKPLKYKLAHQENYKEYV